MAETILVTVIRVFSQLIASRCFDFVHLRLGTVLFQKDDASFSTAPPPEPPVDYEDERKGIV